jgi:gamma-glutamylcysteine synthetase
MGFHYNSKLSEHFEDTMVNEIVDIHTSQHHSFGFMGISPYFPNRVKPLLMYLMMPKRKVFPSNFMLLFSRT